MTKAIAIYGASCSGKSDIAREISRLTGYKVRHPGEAITTRARMYGLDSGADVEQEYHKMIDKETVDWIIKSRDPVIIVESTNVAHVIDDIDDIFRVEVVSKNDERQLRWKRRKEEGGGRSRQIGADLSSRDAADDRLVKSLYGDGVPSKRPNIKVDGDTATAEENARAVWEAFEGKSLDERVVGPTAGKPAMDKKLTKGIRPGPSSGEVTVYSVNRNPFGGYIADDTSGKSVYVHKSAVEAAGLAVIEKGQRLSYVIEEDGVGGFRAAELQVLPRQR